VRKAAPFGQRPARPFGESLQSCLGYVVLTAPVAADVKGTPVFGRVLYATLFSFQGGVVKPTLERGPWNLRGETRVARVPPPDPALALYERLGFRKLREHGVYHFMEWSPESSA